MFIFGVTKAIEMKIFIVKYYHIIWVYVLKFIEKMCFHLSLFCTLSHCGSLGPPLDPYKILHFYQPTNQKQQQIIEITLQKWCNSTNERVLKYCQLENFMSSYRGLFSQVWLLLLQLHWLWWAYMVYMEKYFIIRYVYVCKKKSARVKKRYLERLRRVRQGGAFHTQYLWWWTINSTPVCFKHTGFC